MQTGVPRAYFYAGAARDVYTRRLLPEYHGDHAYDMRGKIIKVCMGPATLHRVCSACARRRSRIPARHQQCVRVPLLPCRVEVCVLVHRYAFVFVGTGGRLQRISAHFASKFKVYVAMLGPESSEA